MKSRAMIIAVSAALAASSVCALPHSAQARDEGERYPAGSRPVAAPGISAEGLLGSGIDSRYGLTEGARVGYTTDSSLYLGGSASRAENEAGASDVLLGGELGYRYFATPKFELRPFGIVGALIEKTGPQPLVETAADARPLVATPAVAEPSATRLALVPGMLAAYHFGHFFVSAEGRLQVVPAPTAASILGGAGLTF